MNETLRWYKYLNKHRTIKYKIARKMGIPYKIAQRIRGWRNSKFILFLYEWVIYNEKKKS